MPDYSADDDFRYYFRQGPLSPIPPGPLGFPPPYFVAPPPPPPPPDVPYCYWKNYWKAYWKLYHPWRNWWGPGYW